MINKFYITDLAPGRSMIEYLVGEGFTVFAISWRNPDARHRDWGLDAYGEAVLDALDAARAITGAAKASLCALCSRGILSAMIAAHLGDTGRASQLASLYLGVTVLDQTREGTTAALIDEPTAELAVAASRARGFLDGRRWPRSRLAPAQRPDLELLGQQLPPGPAAARVRHPLLERRHHPDAGRAAPRLHPAGHGRRAGQA
jgi:poly(3-hydroxyalkanoate) synthetase